MFKSLWTAASGVYSQQLNIDNISNNVANVNTPGYKQSESSFADLLYQINNPPSVAVNPIVTGSGVRLSSILHDFTQGALNNTGRQLDVAIEGQGYFQVQAGNGQTAYTRAGSLQVGPNGELMTDTGNLLLPRINIPAGTQEIKIGKDGAVYSSTNGTLVRLGQINLATFANQDGLEKIGENLFLATGQSGAVTVGAPGTNGLGAVNQGYLEGSNVDLAQQMTNMIMGQRAYELSSRAIRTADEMLSIANAIRR